MKKVLILLSFFKISFCFANQGSWGDLCKEMCDFDSFYQNTDPIENFFGKKIVFFLCSISFDFIVSEKQKAAQFCLYENNLPLYEKFASEYNTLCDKDKYRLLKESARDLFAIAYKKCVLKRSVLYSDLSRSDTGWGLIFSLYFKSLSIIQTNANSDPDFYQEISTFKDKAYDLYEWILERQNSKNEFNYFLSKEYLDTLAENTPYYTKYLEKKE